MDYHEMALNLLKRDRREKRRIERREKAAWSEIERLVARFREIDPDLQRVILFGSLARETVRSVNFDIDLAVQCAADRFLLLVAAGLESEFRVDVIDLASIDEIFCASILEEGMVLYEKH
jgi:predicted nucleotidyltransferase